MNDYNAHLEKLRRDAAECAHVRDKATDHAKREMFDRLSKHLDQLADDIERATEAVKAVPSTPPSSGSCSPNHASAASRFTKALR
jgi:hypothetical protein